MVFSSTITRFCSRRRPATAVGLALGGISVLSAVVVVGGTVGVGRPAERPRAISVSAPCVVVLKSDRLLHLFDGHRLVRTYPIDLGFAPVGDKRRRGDGRTPLGTFRVVTRSAETPYYRFLGLDYPGRAATEFGLANGLVSPGEASAIERALVSGGCPDWSTALGGGIGIHGRRRGSDWTAGCIALSDENVAELFDVLRIGDTVEILP